MEHREQVRIISKALEFIAQRRTDSVDSLFTVPVTTYLDQQQFAAEQRVLFRELPLVVGFSSQVRQAGDYFTHDLTGVPILVVRAQSGELKAFLNVCRHRGAPLVSDSQGSGLHNILCPFHGWCYKDTGQLRAVPHPAGFPGLDMSRHALVELPVAERAGLVFVVPTPGASLDVQQWLEPIGRDLDSFGLDQLQMVRPTQRERRMNWKIHKDTEHENYHFSYLHKNTAGAAYFNNIGVMDCWDVHARIACPQRSITTLSSIDSAAWRIQDHVMLYYSIFPNTGLVFFNGYAHVLMTFPQDVDRTILYGAMLVPPDSDAQEQARQQLHYDSYWATMTEDLEIGVAAQRGLLSGANEHFTFGGYERVAANFHQTITRLLTQRAAQALRPETDGACGAGQNQPG